MINKLYGDGIHDDTLALQEMIDNAGCELVLDNPEVCYLISAPLELPSNFKLKLPRFAEVKLKGGSNVPMLQNKTVKEVAKRKNKGIFDYLNVFSPNVAAENIEVEGGIWNYNNLEQDPNPLLKFCDDGLWHWAGHRHHKDNNIDIPEDELDNISYNGYIFLFYNIKNIRISSLTLKDPVTFAVTLDTCTYFTVNDIVFDFNHGNPLACNMDGIHLNGNCHYGEIRNLQGACHDDLVAINADEGSSGPITNVTVDGIYATDCHSAVRLLSAQHAVKNIHITNVYGTYYQYCIGVTRFYEPNENGYFQGITLDNIYASKAERLDVYNHKGSWVYAIIQVDERIRVKDLKIANLHREEYITPVETIHVNPDTVIERLILDNISTENHTDADGIQTIVNQGEIKHLYANEIYNDGKEEKIEV